MRLGRNGCVSYERQNYENRDEAEKRNKGEERDFLSVILGVNVGVRVVFCHHGVQRRRRSWGKS